MYLSFSLLTRQSIRKYACMFLLVYSLFTIRFEFLLSEYIVNKIFYGIKQFSLYIFRQRTSKLLQITKYFPFHYSRWQFITALSQAPLSRQVKVGWLGSGSLYPSLQLKVQMSLTFLAPTTKQSFGLTEVPATSTRGGQDRTISK